MCNTLFYITLGKKSYRFAKPDSAQNADFPDCPHSLPARNNLPFAANVTFFAECCDPPSDGSSCRERVAHALQVDLAVRGVPDRLAALHDDGLWRFMPDLEARFDLVGEGALE